MTDEELGQLLFDVACGEVTDDDAFNILREHVASPPPPSAGDKRRQK